MPGIFFRHFLFNGGIYFNLKVLLIAGICNIVLAKILLL